MSLRGLPGKPEEWFDILLAILNRIREKRPSLQELVAWATKNFRVGKSKMEDGIRSTIIRCSLASIDAKTRKMRLTSSGRELLKTRDPTILLKAFRKNIWGVEEILSLLEERAMTLDEIFDALRKLGARWRTPAQVKYRLEWLKGLGVISQDENGYYRLKEQAPPPEALEIKQQLNHERLVEMICDIGEVLGFTTRKEISSPDAVFRYDVLWLEEEYPVKAFEVELSGNLERALTRLAYAYDERRMELFLIVPSRREQIRVRRLLQGPFRRIKEHTMVLTSSELLNLYDDIMKHEAIIKKLAGRRA